MSKSFLLKIIFAIFILSISTYLIFFSPLTANNEALINIRNKTNSKADIILSDLLPSKTSNKHIDNSIWVYSKTKNNTFYYGYIGIFDHVDISTNTIYLKSDNSIYAFQISDIASEYKPGTMLVRGQNMLGTRSNYYFSNESIHEEFFIAWEDTRSLNEILNDHKNSPTIDTNKGRILYFSKPE